MGSTPSIEKSGVTPVQGGGGEGGNRASSKISQQFREFGAQASNVSAHGDVIANLRSAATLAFKNNDVGDAERCVVALECLLEVAPDDAFAALMDVAQIFGQDDAMAGLVERIGDRLTAIDPNKVFAHLELYKAM